MGDEPETAKPEGDATPKPSSPAEAPSQAPNPLTQDFGVAAVLVEAASEEPAASEAIAASESRTPGVAPREAITASEAETTPGSELAKVGDPGKERMDLPKWNRARVKRKTAAAAEQDDAFQGTVRQAGRFTVQRAPVVLAAIVLVAAVIAGGQWLISLRTDHSAGETRLLAEAVGDVSRGVVDEKEAAAAEAGERRPRTPVFADDGKQAQAIDAALDELRTKAEGSPADVASDLVRAARAMDAAEFADAEAKYRAFIDRHLEHELLFLAREGLALALIGQGKLELADAELVRLSGQPGDFYRDQALWHRARLAEQRDDRDGALELYKQYAAEFPLRDESLACRQVIERLEALAPELVPEDARPGCGLGRLMGFP